MKNKERFIVKKEVHEELLKNGPKKYKLLFDPASYSRSAIECLEGQLKGVRSEKRKQKLLGRINDWKKELEILESLYSKENEEKENDKSETNKISKVRKVSKAKKSK